MIYLRSSKLKVEQKKGLSVLVCSKTRKQTGPE